MTLSAFCLCTMDEFLDGHRHHCIEHKPCSECEPEEVYPWDEEE